MVLHHILRKNQMRLLVIFSIPIIFFASNSWAGCKSDCKDEYQAAKEECQSLYDDPGDADQLQNCIDDAYSNYESCIEDCES